MRRKLQGWTRRAGICALALALGMPLPAAASDAPAAGLAGAVEQAWRRHPEAAALDARDAEARAARDMAGGLTPEPASVSLGNLSDRQARNLGKQEWEVELAVPLWLPGQQDARAAEAESRIGDAAARRTAAKLEVAGELRETWWSLAASRAATQRRGDIGLIRVGRRYGSARAPLPRFPPYGLAPACPAPSRIG